jgi:DNA-binding Lrp family transcriptional regulator
VHDDLDERDLQLLHALQIAPRVSWTEAADVLDTTPATLATRWRRLRSEGLAWVCAQPGADYRHVTLALVEVDCQPGARAEVVEALCAEPLAVTVEESTRGRDLLLTVLTRGLELLGLFLFDRLERLPGVARHRCSVATAVHRHGSHWRLDALDADQERALHAVTRRPVHPPTHLPPNSGPIIRALTHDGRATAADLARITGRNPATVRRQLARLHASDTLSFRCELATGVSGWSVSSTWTARVPPADAEHVVTSLGTLPELRMCLSTTGETNIALTVWTRSVAEIPRIEQLFAERLPQLEVHDIAVNLRTPKRMGWLLDTQGRATGTVITPSALIPTAAESATVTDA